RPKSLLGRFLRLWTSHGSSKAGAGSLWTRADEFQMSSHTWLSRRICIPRMIDTIVANNIPKIERAQTREAGDNDAELIRIRIEIRAREVLRCTSLQHLTQYQRRGGRPTPQRLREHHLSRSECDRARAK